MLKIIVALALLPLALVHADAPKPVAPPRFAIAVTSKGFEPDNISVPAGKPVTLVFTRKTDATCTVKGVDGRWLAPDAFKNINVGWESYQHDVAGAHDAWIDDVILDDQPIPCP
jgi:plastocyanin